MAPKDKPLLDVDPAEGRTAVMYVRDAEGRDWILGALLSDLSPSGHDAPGRPIRDDEELKLIAFHVVAKEA